MSYFAYARPLAVALALSWAGSAGAVTVASGGTDTTGAGGFSLVGGGTLIDTNLPGFYFQGDTDPSSQWIWRDPVGGFDELAFTFQFDLTGFNPAATTLSGRWGVDNTGTVSLNGNLLSSLPGVILANFNVLTDFSTSNPAHFNPGLNTLLFQVQNAGGPAGFRASVTVTSQLGNGPGTDPDPSPAPIPLPASLPLLVGALALLGLSRAKRRRS